MGLPKSAHLGLFLKQFGLVFGPPQGGDRQEASFLGPLFGLIFGTFFGRFSDDFKESPKSDRKAFSSIKPEVFAKAVNKNIEFYRRKKPSKCISSRRNRTDFSQEKICKNLQFSILFEVRCEKTDGFSINELERCSKTHQFLHIESRKVSKTAAFCYIFAMKNRCDFVSTKRLSTPFLYDKTREFC